MQKPFGLGRIITSAGTGILAGTAGAVLVAATGCTVLTATDSTNANGGTTESPQPPGGAPATFSVTIATSNSTPQLNEEVRLRCMTTDAATEVASFSFQTADVDLQVDATAGTASFIVTDFELGLTIDVTCTATDADGNTATSPRVSVFPTG